MEVAHIVDLRSDSVTNPTESMKHAMVNAALGDDVYQEDPTVNELEKKIALMLGKQDALYVPSGTMANLIAIMVHCNKRGREALVGHKSHIFKFEQGGASHVGGVLLSTLRNKPDGTFDLQEFEDHIRGTDIHEPITTLVAVENTHNVGGGKVLPEKFLEDLSTLAKKYKIAVHMDGARLFNACTYLQKEPSEVVKTCDSVSVCFNKGLAAPVGSALVGSYQFIEQARRVRKMLGGGMSQAGVIAAAALVSLQEVRPLLVNDQKQAETLANAIYSLGLKSFKVDLDVTNIVMVKISPSCSIKADQVVARLTQVSLNETQGDCKTKEGDGVIVKCVYFDSKTIRLTLHYEITVEDLRLAIMKITYVFREFERMETETGARHFNPKIINQSG